LFFNFAKKIYNMEENKNKIVVFQEKNVRRVWHNEQWYFSVIDVIEVLTESPNPRKYWSVLKVREPQLATNCSQLKLMASDGKSRSTDVANTEGIFRILMSVPSPKVEPFKLWLAQVGKERLDEQSNPEIAIERARTIYKAKGYSDKWIESRIKSIDIRKQLTDEWYKRGVKEGQEYSILTAEIAKATFGISPSEHKSLKNLKKENLRDHMTNLELIFTMLGEEMTHSIAVQENSQGFIENHDAARKGGKAAGVARDNAEKVSGVKVLSKQNFLNINQDETSELPENF
jgi:DNA-damage-inducible protein D